MATPKKLPSGNWRIRVFSHIDANGKKVYKSFTAPDKKKVMKLAHEFQDNKEEYPDKELTIAKAIADYIDSKEGVLSPSTIREYRRLQNKAYSSIETIYVSRVTSKDLQYFVSDLSRDHSPKSVRNIYSLLLSAIQMHTDKRYKVTLPQKEVINYSTPDDKEVRILLDNASDKLKLCIYLSAIGTLRRGEISALKYSDVLYDINAIYVHADMIKDKNNTWIYKPVPKNSSSVRKITLPKEIISLIGKGEQDDYIVSYNPDYITHKFCKLRNKLGLKCRFHDLRHYAATIRMYMGIPLKEIQAVGGWSSSATLQKVYVNQLKSKSVEYTKKANEYFEDNLLSNQKKNIKYF